MKIGRVSASADLRVILSFVRRVKRRQSQGYERLSHNEREEESFYQKELIDFIACIQFDRESFVLKRYRIENRLEGIWKSF